MSALKDFQNRFGAEWIRLSNHEAFLAGLALANGEKLLRITQLSDAEIETHGKIILADLRGHMNYESGLLGLAEKKEFVFQQLPPEEYPDPAAEAREEARLAEMGEQGEESSDRSSSAFVPPADAHQQIFPEEKKGWHKGPKIEINPSATKPKRKKKK